MQSQEEIQYFFQKGGCLRFQVEPTLGFQLSYSVGNKTSPSLPSQALPPRSLQPVACDGREKKKKTKNEVPMSPGVSAGDTTSLKHFKVLWSITDTCRAP